MVAVWMVTYNHEEFIEKAIESVMIQKTTFQYKLFIGEDNSIDNTREICEKLKEKYADKIEYFLHEENIGATPNGIFMYEQCFKSEAKYIALLEGDDYWTDPYKLQKQIDYMEDHTECSLCLHASTDVSETGEFIKKRERYKTDSIVSMEDLILGGGGFAAFASTLFPSEFRNLLPDYYHKSPVGDVPLHLFLASRGEVFYLHDNMSSYRTSVPGSWTSRVGDGIGELQRIKQNFMSDMYLDFSKTIEAKYRIYAEFMSLKCQIHRLRMLKKFDRSQVDIPEYISSELNYIKAKAIIHFHRHFKKQL